MAETYAGFGGLIHSIDRDGPPQSTGDEKRLVEHKNGLRVWVTITQQDRKRIIDFLPKGWDKVVRDREAGQSIEQLADRYRMTTHEMRTYLGMAYGKVEQDLYRLAETRSGLRDPSEMSRDSMQRRNEAEARK